MWLTQLLLLMGNELLKSFFPHFLNQSSHQESGCHTVLIIIGNLAWHKKKAKNDPKATNVWHRFLGMVNPKEKPSRGKLGAAGILC